MIETVLATIVILCVGVFIGSGPSKLEETNKTKQEQRVTPDQWPPVNQIEMMKACSIVCGKHRVDSYDSLRGECKCLK